MPPQALSLALFILEAAIKDAPALAAELKVLFTKTDPTPDDWAALHLRVAAKTYRDYVPATALRVVEVDVTESQFGAVTILPDSAAPGTSTPALAPTQPPRPPDRTPGI